MSLTSRLEEAFSTNNVASILTLILEEKTSMSFIECLDEVASKELHKNEFKNVTLVLRALEQVISKDEACTIQLVHHGLVMVCEHLKVQQKPSKAPVRLMEVFYEVSMRLCQSNTEDSSKILEVLLLRFGAVVIDQEVNFNLRLEAIKTINSLLDSASKETRKKLTQSDHNSLLEEFAKVITDVGDYEMQVAISEALCRMTPKKLREELVGKWFSYRSFASSFTTIRVKEFETDCRIFLNKLNSYFGDKRRVFSYPCIRAFLDTTELFKPNDELLQNFWVDFNIGTSCVGFYVNDPQGTLWELIHLPKESVSSYNLRECDDMKILSIHMLVPVFHGKISGKLVQITFASEHDIQTPVEKVFGGEDPQLLEESKPTTVIEDDSGIQTTPSDCMQTLTSTPAKETTGRPQVSFFLQSGPGKLSSVKARIFPGNDSFNLTNESDTEVTFLTDVSVRSHDLKTRTLTFIAALWRYQVARAKTVMFCQSHSSNGSASSVRSLPVLGELRKSTEKRKLKEFYSESETCESRNTESLSRINPKFDYSRKKPRIKSKLKVLPLSSPSSNEESYFKESTPKHRLKMGKEGDERRTLDFSHPYQESNTNSSFQDKTCEYSVFLDVDADVSMEENSADKEPPSPPRKRAPTFTALNNTYDMTDGHPESDDQSSLPKLRPRRLFTSNLDSTAETSQTLVEDEDVETGMSSGVMAAFNSLKTQLREHFSSRYELAEAKSLKSLTDCQKTVTSLLRTVHNQRLVHLEHFQDAVVQQLEHMERNCYSLKSIEKETVGFWQSVSNSVKDFCNKQQKRLDTLDITQGSDEAPHIQTEGTEATTSEFSDLHTLPNAVPANVDTEENPKQPE